MTLLASLPRIEEHRVSVVFDCPKCREHSVRGTAYNLRETIKVSHRMPLWGWSSHWVRCSHCRAELLADCDPQSFQGASPATVSDQVHAYLPFPKRFLAVAGLLMAWAPLVGGMVAIVSMAANAKSKGWTRVASLIAVVLAAVYNATLFGTMVYWSIQVAKPLAMN